MASAYHCSGVVLISTVLFAMPVSIESEKALPRFVESIASNAEFQGILNDLTDIDSLRKFINSLEPTLTGAALIPYEQATSPPKITIDSGVLEAEIAWRLLRCPGGPLVLQMICKKVNFAVWIEAC